LERTILTFALVRCFFLVLGAILTISLPVFAQERPYFVTYSTDLEEPGNLEIALKSLAASPAHANSFYSPTLEVEYGATGWWTTEAYLQGQSTVNDSTVLTGFRLENRFRPLPRQYAVTPVIYIEYENISDADKSILEVTGRDGVSNFKASNAEDRTTVNHTLEGKLILSSNLHGWNISENMIAEKNLSNHPWEFGYAVGASRPFSRSSESQNCFLCWNSLEVGAELYGGLGTRYEFGLKNTSQYAGPTAALRLPHGTTVSFSPQFGLNDNSLGVLWRFKVSFEFQQIRDIFTAKDAK